MEAMALSAIMWANIVPLDWGGSLLMVRQFVWIPFPEKLQLLYLKTSAKLIQQMYIAQESQNFHKTSKNLKNPPDLNN